MAAGSPKVLNDLLDDFAKLWVNLKRIVATSRSGPVRASANADVLVVAPFVPSMIFVDRHHLTHFSGGAVLPSYKGSCRFSVASPRRLRRHICLRHHSGRKVPFNTGLFEFPAQILGGIGNAGGTGRND